jgi:YggT family protein
MAPKGHAKARKKALLRGSPVSGRHLRPGGGGVKAPRRRAIAGRALVRRRLSRYMFARFNRLVRFMRALLDVILIALQIYVWLLIAAAILSWLIAFNVVNTRNPFVATVGEFLYRITEPALRPIRGILPNLGGIDISPVILILLIFLIERIILYYIYPNVI